MTDLTVNDGTGHLTTIHTTASHPFWNATTKRWTKRRSTSARHQALLANRHVTLPLSAAFRSSG